MKIELEEVEVKIILDIINALDPHGFFTRKLANKILEQVKKAKDEVTLMEKK